MGSRAHWRDHATDKKGNVLPGATINVYQLGTTTPITQTIYKFDSDHASQATTLAQGFLAGDEGQVEFYLAEPQRCTLKITSGGRSRTITADVADNPSDVQEALDELDTEKAAKAGDTFTGQTNHTRITIKESPYLDLEHPDYGLVFNDHGVDNRAAMQAIIDSLPGKDSANPGRVLLAPPGKRLFIGAPGLVIDNSNWALRCFAGAPFGASGAAVNNTFSPFEFVGSAAGLVLLTIGPATATPMNWRGFELEGIGFRDVSAGSNQLAGGIHIREQANGTLRNVQVNRMRAGYGVKLGVDGSGTANPQYTTFYDPKIWDCLYGVRQAHICSDTQFFGGLLWGGGASTTPRVGSIGVESYNTMRMYSTAVQYFETDILLLGDHNRLYSAVETSDTTPGLYGVDVAGDFNQIFCDFANQYTGSKIRIRATGDWNTIGPMGITNPATTNIENLSTSTMIFDPAYGLRLAATAILKTGQSITANRPSAATVGKGAQFFDTTLDKPIWSDGAAWRDAAGTVV